MRIESLWKKYEKQVPPYTHSASFTLKNNSEIMQLLNVSGVHLWSSEAVEENSPKKHPQDH